MTQILDSTFIRYYRTAIAITRKGQGSFINGRYVPAGASSTFTIDDACVQPVTPDELLLLPEGFRAKENITIYSREKLQTIDLKTKQEADLVVYNGKTYEVHFVHEWQAHGGYWKAIAVKYAHGEALQ